MSVIVSTQCDKAASTAQLKGFIAHNTTESRKKWELDTARMYTRGYTEKMLGEIFAENPELKEQCVHPLVDATRATVIHAVAAQVHHRYEGQPVQGIQREPPT